MCKKIKKNKRNCLKRLYSISKSINFVITSKTNLVLMKKIYSIKDFGNSNGVDIRTQSHNFQKFVDQTNSFGHKSYWVMATSGVGASMDIEEEKIPVSAFISNDYLGMSQTDETKRAGIDALLKYGTGACAAQAIGGYLDIHRQLEIAIAQFTG